MLDTALAESLAKVLGRDNLFTQEDDLERYSTDALTPSRAFRAAPSLERTADVVVIPRSVNQVVAVVKLASEHKVPIIPYGGGTGVMGAALPVRGGIVMDLKGLNKVLEVNPTDMAVLVEAGAVLEDLENALRPHGLPC
jgi:FAD/FMN-containing dehydrogenase